MKCYVFCWTNVDGYIQTATAKGQSKDDAEENLKAEYTVDYGTENYPEWEVVYSHTISGE